MRNKGIITILVGIGVLFISIFFSSGYHGKSNLMDNVYYRMEIVLYEEEKVLPQGRFTSWLAEHQRQRRVAIPLTYPLSLSVLLILLGTGIVLLSKNKEPST